MNQRITVLALALAAFAGPALAQSDTTFTYQAELREDGQPANGPHDLAFSLWDALSGGNQIGSTIALDDVPVEDGLVTVELDFGANAFDNSGRWLQVDVNGVPLDPRQPITRSPYSIQTRGIFVDGEERVGIGTTDVQDFTAATIRGRGVNSDWLQFQSTDGTNEWHLSGTNGGLDFVQTGVEANRLFLAPGGRIGIGTNDPQSRLHLASGELRFPDGSVLERSPIVASGTFEANFGPIPGGGNAISFFPLSGTMPGDIVVISVRGDTPQPFVLHGAHVPVPDQVRFNFINTGSQTHDPPLFLYDVLVLRP